MDAAQEVEGEITALMNDEIAVNMAAEVVSKAMSQGVDPIKLIDHDYTEFMIAAFETYRQRGGKDVAFGVPGQAVKRIAVIMVTEVADKLDDLLESMQQAIRDMKRDMEAE